MLFNSLTFLVFFIIVYALFWLLPNWQARKILLLIASYIFYAAWNPPYVFILLASTFIDWWLAKQIGRTNIVLHKKIWLAISLLVNLLLLSYFKYGQLLLDTFVSVARQFGIHYQAPSLDIILPIGISFYTFASLSYTIDVYRGQIHSKWSFTNYALFVSFFPHLVAGPIVRAYYLLPQIEQPRSPTSTQIGWGFVMVIAGLFCKVVLADSAFAPLVDALYNQPANQHAFNTWLGVLSFSGQIYYDFAGYSLCAIGLALCFGFNFPDNFRTPYAARGFSDFWRRWHISLSSWLRDYLYISLGGNRLGTARTLINLMLVMLIGGMWHGASWMFALWGGLHGLFLILERFINTLKIKLIRDLLSPTFIPELITFLLVTLAWIPFRAVSPTQALTVLHNLTNRNADLLLENQHIITIFMIVIMLVLQFKFRHFSFDETFSKLPTYLQSLLILFFLLGLFLFSGGDQRAFIYFQF